MDEPDSTKNTGSDSESDLNSASELDEEEEDGEQHPLLILILQSCPIFRIFPLNLLIIGLYFLASYILSSALMFYNILPGLPNFRVKCRSRRLPKESTYRGVCTGANGDDNNPSHSASLKLRLNEIDRSQVPITPGFIFKLFFTSELVVSICKLTNACAETQKELKAHIYKDWVPLSPEEFYRFLALLIFMTQVKVPRLIYYWSDNFLHESLCSQVMSKARYRQIQSFLKVSEPDSNRKDVEFSQVDAIYESMRGKCMQMWEPDLARMHRSIPLNEVKDIVTYFWEDIDELEQCEKQREQQEMLRSMRNKKGWVLLGGFGQAANLQWKDRELASSLIIMHKDLKRRVLRFNRYKNLGKDTAFGDASFYGREGDELLVGENDVLIGSTKAWKAVFYHLIDVAWLTSYLIFEEYRTCLKRAKDPHLCRLSRYAAHNFMTDLVKELAALPEQKVNFCCSGCRPVVKSFKERCARCIRVERVVRKTKYKCLECEEYFCFNMKRNCLADTHHK